MSLDAQIPVYPHVGDSFRVVARFSWLTGEAEARHGWDDERESFPLHVRRNLAGPSAAQ
jgi:hypothetical protein